MTQTVTPLRQRMLDDMKLRNMAASTRKIYVASVAGFSAYHGRSPDQLTLRGRARLPAAPGRPRAQGQQHLPDHERLALLLRHHARQARGGGRQIPLPRKADPCPPSSPGRGARAC